LSDEIDSKKVNKNSEKETKLGQIPHDPLAWLTPREARVLRLRFGMSLEAEQANDSDDDPDTT